MQLFARPMQSDSMAVRYDGDLVGTALLHSIAIVLYLQSYQCMMFQCVVQAKAALQKRAEDDEKLLLSTEAMLQQLQATLAATRQEVAAHQDALEGSQSIADSLKARLDASVADKNAQETANVETLQLLQSQIEQLQQQLSQVQNSLKDAQAVTLAKQAHILRLELSVKGELVTP